ncbi:MAG: tRNA (N(6)-L-threonylcarbamoyladenosine(37)-C(2))-methylthiotransferase, partial [Nitrospiraceae bacterium]|nr:tRNA (N(6)-L-threonylcarbamoyladenosine(37)-C(2))-methylthiotransferase [Nitrospiraceae bacterium]
DIASIATVVDAESRGEHVVYLDNKDKNIYDVEMPLVRKIIGILPISEGCLGNCSYCKTKYSRGKLLSYPLRDILRQAESYVKRGAKEIWLTSQDTGCYGLDIGFTIVDLLKELANIEGDFRVRIGMMNPNYAFRFRKEIADVINKSNKFFKFLHIPIQSGNDRVLKLMKRQYTTGVALEAVKYLKSNIKNLSFATDVICGFPTETDDEFDDTIKFIRETRPTTLNISRFWPRPGTEAAKMKQFYNQVMIKRANKIREVFNEIVIEENRKWIGWEGRALFDEYGKSSDGVKSIILRNDSYKQIVVRFKELASDEIINEGDNEKIRNEKNNYEIINDKEVGNKEVDVNNRDSLSENINEKKIDETNTNKEKSSNDEKIRLRDMRLKDIRLGDFIMVKVKDATTVDLRAEIIRND